MTRRQFEQVMRATDQAARATWTAYLEQEAYGLSRAQQRRLARLMRRGAALLERTARSL